MVLWHHPTKAVASCSRAMRRWASWRVSEMDEGSRSRPGIEFTVEVGTDGEPRLRITAGGHDFPMQLTSAQAAELGQALLTASVICHPKPNSLMEGMLIPEAPLPLVRWAAGRSRATGLAIAQMETRGGTTLRFKMHPQTAGEFGLALANASSSKVSSS